MDNIKLFMCSLAGKPSSGLSFGKHFSGCMGNGFNGLAIWKTPRFFHGLWSIMGIYVEEDVPMVEGDWVEENVVPLLVWITIWSGEVDDWSRDGIDGMNEDDERTSLWDSDGVFLALFRLGRGNSNKGIPNFSLCALVNRWDGMNWEVTLSWDNLDCPWDSEIPCNLWIKAWTSGASVKKDDMVCLGFQQQVVSYFVQLHA